MNVVMHGNDGLLCAEINSGKVILDISDEGPGIEDINLAMQKGYTTAKDEYREMGFGAGMGLPNMKKNADHMTVESGPKKGTLIRMFFNIAKEE
jgi:anti-sigma regulatory factor (Ser/Thr protein kinase)